MTTPIPTPTTVAVVTLGCARNEVDSEELAGRLAAEGFTLVDDPEQADTVMVNTCGFVEAAKKDSVDTLLAAADLKSDGQAKAVVAVGCMAERYGSELAEALPEADAVLGFDAYPDIGAKLRAILAGETQHPHTPRDRRKLLPISPTDRRADSVVLPGHGQPVAAPVDPDSASVGQNAPSSGPPVVRRRLEGGPMAPLKLASGCDRRCAFCAIPAFRGSFISRRPTEVVQEARWLAGQGVRELFLVSENSTSYGKDLGDLRLLETLLPELTAIEGIDWVRVSYLQPAEIRPGLLEAIAGTPGVVPYFDLSFQHAAPEVLRRMRRFGDPDAFLALLERIRALVPTAGVRSNVIVGFPGETDHDVQLLCDFLEAARLDVTGVFGYSDEDGTEAETLSGKIDPEIIAARTERVQDLVEELSAQRAEERIGEEVEVLVEVVEGEAVEGRAQFQGPEVDGTTRLLSARDAQVQAGQLRPLAVGDLVKAKVVASEGVDLVAQVSGLDQEQTKWRMPDG